MTILGKSSLERLSTRSIRKMTRVNLITICHPCRVHLKLRFLASLDYQQNPKINTTPRHWWDKARKSWMKKWMLWLEEYLFIFLLFVVSWKVYQKIMLKHLTKLWSCTLYDSVSYDTFFYLALFYHSII